MHDTWFVSGLAGSGSLDISASDVFVPDARVFALPDPARHRAEPLYQMPPLGLFVLQLAAVGLGIARHFTVAPHTWEESGRVLLGRPTIAPVF